MAVTKLSPWAAKREGTLNRFYTRSAVGEVLVREIGDKAPTNVLDLGAGEGSLSTAVVRKWASTHITTVDIDPTCVNDLHTRLANAGALDHEHQLLDVFDPELPDWLCGRTFDLAVCNPPFFRPKWNREFADILQAANFADACPTQSEVTAEILFLAQNLRLVRDGGVIALIVPDGLATGWRAIAFRQALMRHHTLRSAVQLPPYSFLDTEAFCFVLVIEKGCRQADQPVKLLRLDQGASVSEPLFIMPRSAEVRLDFAYHSLAQVSPSGAITLRQLGADVRRGSLTTVDRKRIDEFVFHTGDFPRRASSVTLCGEIPNTPAKNLVVAQAGDILMARVDRDLHDKITFVASGQAAITDCVYRIRVPEEHRRGVFEALSSEDGRARIQAATKGVGARLLGKGELLDLPLRGVSAA